MPGQSRRPPEAATAPHRPPACSGRDGAAYVESCDGDALIYYDLSQGFWRSDNARNAAELVRVAADRYELGQPGGQVYIYRGYRAPWRSGQAPDAGRLTQIRDADGNAVTLAYDPAGHLTTIADTAGRFVRLTYDDPAHPGQVTSVTDPLGRVWTFTYGPTGRLAGATSPRGLAVSYLYDTSGRLIAIRDQATGQTRYTRDTSGRITRVEADGWGTVIFTYEALALAPGSPPGSSPGRCG